MAGLTKSPGCVTAAGASLVSYVARVLGTLAPRVREAGNMPFLIAIHLREDPILGFPGW